MYKMLKAKNEPKHVGNERAKLGVWVGWSGTSKGHFIGTDNGVVRARSIWRRPYSERWSAEKVKGMRGTPMQPDHSKNTTRVPVKINMPFPDMPLPEEIRTEKRNPVRRRMKITAADLERDGYTEGCPGCENSRRGLYAREHTEACRERIERLHEEKVTGRNKKQEADKRMAEQREQQEETQSKKTRSDVQETGGQDSRSQPEKEDEQRDSSSSSTSSSSSDQELPRQPEPNEKRENEADDSVLPSEGEVKRRNFKL